jgi:hypothetical protein
VTSAVGVWPPANSRTNPFGPCTTTW